MPKVVFTKTLDESPWNNTTLAKGNPADEIADLKNKLVKTLLSSAARVLFHH